MYKFFSKYKFLLFSIVIFNFVTQIVVLTYGLIQNDGKHNISPDAELYLEISYSIRNLLPTTTGKYSTHIGWHVNKDIGYHIMPGYPLLISLFFENLYLISLFQTILFSLGLFCLFKLLYNKYLALFALITPIWIILTSSWSYHCQPLIESTTISFLLIVIYYLDRYFKNYSTKDIILFSIFFGILIALNNRYIFHFCGILPFFLFLKFFEKRIKIKHLIYSFLVVTLIMTPWHIRQYVVNGEFILFSNTFSEFYNKRDSQKDRWLDYSKVYKYREYLKDTINHPLKDNPKELEEGRKLYLERVKQYAEDQRKINEGIIKVQPPKIVYEPAIKRLKEEKELLASNDNKALAKEQARLLQQRKSLVGLNEKQSKQKKDKTTDLNNEEDFLVEYRTKPENNPARKNEIKLNTKNNIKPDIAIPRKSSDKNITQQAKNEEADTSFLLSNIDTLIIKDNNIHSNVIKEEIKPSLHRKDELISVAERKNLESRKVESSKKEDTKSISSNMKEQSSTLSRGEERKTTLSKKEEELAINERRELESKGISSGRQEDTKSITGKQQEISQSIARKEEIKPSLQRKDEQSVAERKNLESRKVESSKKEDAKSISSNMKEQKSTTSRTEERNTTLSKREEEPAINERKALESKGISSGRQEDNKSITGKQQEISQSIARKEEIKPSLQRKDEQSVAEKQKAESRKIESSKKEENKLITENRKSERKATESRKESGIGKQEIVKKQENIAVSESKNLESRKAESMKKSEIKKQGNDFKKKIEQKQDERNDLIVKLDTQFVVKKKAIPNNISSNINKTTSPKRIKTDTLVVIQKTVTDTSTNPKIKKKKPVISQDTVSTVLASNLFLKKHKEEVIEFEDDKMFISFEGIKVKQLRTSDFENELEFRKFNDQRVQKMVPTYDEIVNALLKSQPKFGETPEKLYEFINDFSFEKYKQMVNEKSIPNRFTIVWDRFVDHFVFYRSDFLLNPQWDPRIRYPSYYRNTIYLLLDIIMMPLIFINIIPLLIGIYKRDWLIVSLAVLVFLHILLHSLVAGVGDNGRYRLTIYPAWITFAVYGYDQITRYIIHVFKNRTEYKQRISSFLNRKPKQIGNREL